MALARDSSHHQKTALSSLVTSLRNGTTEERSEALVSLLSAIDEAGDANIVVADLVATDALPILVAILSGPTTHRTASASGGEWCSQDRATAAFLLQAVLGFPLLAAAAHDAGALPSLVTYLSFCDYDDTSAGGRDALWGRQAAVEALGALVVNGNGKWRASVVLSGAIVPLVALLSNPEDNDQLKLHAAWVLGNLAAREEIRSEAAPSLEELLSGDGGGGGAGCSAVVRLVPEPTAQLSILIAPGAVIPALIALMHKDCPRKEGTGGGDIVDSTPPPRSSVEQPPPEMTLAHAATRLLGRLVLDNLAATGEIGQAVPMLLEMFKEGDEVARGFAEQALDAHASADPSGQGAVWRMVAERPEGRR